MITNIRADHLRLVHYIVANQAKLKSHMLAAGSSFLYFQTLFERF